MTLDLADVGVIRRGRKLLDGVSLTVQAGQLTAILGPNGAGKSTLLRVCSGDLAPEEGGARLDGVDLLSWPLDQIAKRRAVLPQLSGLEFPFTVREVVRLGRLPHGDADSGSGAALVERALTAMELGGLADRRYPLLSGGERQRTHAARVLAQLGLEGRPGAWLLLDEPTSALDLVHQHRLMENVRAFVDGGGGAIAVLHDPNLAARYADRIALVSRGQVVAEGPPDRILDPDILGPVYGVRVDVVHLDGWDHPLVVAGGRDRPEPGQTGAERSPSAPAPRP